MPSLWRIVDILNLHPDLARVFMQRSAALPLDLTICPPDEVRPHVDDASYPAAINVWRTPAVLRRLRSLSLQGLQIDKYLGHLRPFLPLSPSLRELRLHVYGFDGGINTTVFLPQNTICAPVELERLSLRGCFARPDNALFSPTITHMDIHLGGYAPGPEISSAQDFLRIISTMPRLEKLFLVNFPGPSEDKTIVNHALPSCFRLLRWCTNGGNDGMDVAMAAFLSGLQIPAHAAMVVSVENCSSADSVGELKRHTLWDMRSSQTPLELISLSRGGFSLVPWHGNTWTTQVLAQHSAMWLDDVSLPFGSRCISGHRADPLYSEPEAVTPDQVLHAIHAFTIGEGSSHLDEPTNTSYWMTRCALIPNARCITVPLFHSYWIMATIGMRSEETGRPEILPDLEILALDILVDEDHSLSDHTSHKELDAPMITIAYMLERRRDMGSPLKEIRIRKSLASCDVWDRLRELVSVTTCS